MKYAGITIGPIFDTISNAVSPAALWFASTFFSDLTRRLCMKITAEFSGRAFELLSPYFDKEDEGGLMDGVGKYHDRIFFRASDIPASGLKALVDETKGEMTEVFGKDFFENQEREERAKKFLKSYLQIHFIILDKEQLDGDNCILKISPYLDALELMKSFPVSDKDNPIRRIMKGKKDAGNVLIKESTLYKSVAREQNPLLSRGDAGKGRIRDIQEIARGSKESGITDEKYLNYYAVVSADADGMGKFLKEISEEDTQKFSKRCLSYDKKAAAMINEYGGMTIYAGGDDLLFLAPLENGNKTIFDVCEEISAVFQKEISGEEFKDCAIPTVSFGISAQYYKYPLYEALSRSRACLEKAKKHTFEGKDGILAKNCIYFHLEKHSGQSADILIGNEALNAYKELLWDMLNAENTRTDSIDENMVKSLGAKLYECKNMISVMDDSYKKKEREKPFWDNIFDNEGQASGEEFRKRVEEWYYHNLVDEKKRIVSSKEEDSGHENKRELDSLLAVLRINKFFLEKGGSKE